MADKRRFNSKMNAKGLEASVSESQAEHMANHQGQTYVFVVKAHSGPKLVEEDGSQVVSLIPDLVELVPAEHEQRLLDFQRALYLARPDQHGQEAFDGATPDEPTLEGSAAGIDAVVDTSGAEPTFVGDPAAPLPGGDAAPTAPPAEGQAEGPWPGDEGYVPSEGESQDDLAARRLAQARAELGDDEATTPTKPAAKKTAASKSASAT